MCTDIYLHRQELLYQSNKLFLFKAVLQTKLTEERRDCKIAIYTIENFDDFCKALEKEFKNKKASIINIFVETNRLRQNRNKSTGNYVIRVRKLY